MELLSFNDLYKKLRDSDETVAPEAKRASEIGKSIQESICAFANEPDMSGGYLLLGVEKTENALFPVYEVVGVSDPEKLQSDLATQCWEIFSIPIRPSITIEQHDGKHVIVTYIPESQAHDKPVYIKRRGVHKGAFRRVGPTDRLLTPPGAALSESDRENGANPIDKAKYTRSNPVDKAKSLGLEPPPTDVVTAIQALGHRTSPEKMKDAIRTLCAWRPLSALQLAEFVGRSQPYLLANYLRPMVRDHELEFTQQTKAHPKQAYRTPSGSTEGS